MKRIVSGLGLPNSAGKSIIEKWYVIRAVSTHPAPNAVKRDNRDAETRLPNDKHRLIALLIPAISTAKLSAANLKDIRGENCGHAFRLRTSSTH
jgi:hypothetical protein